MKKVLVTGKTGMLGSAVHRILNENDIDVVGLSRKDLDALNCSECQIKNLLEGFDYVINCIGIIKPYIHENNAFEVQRAITINSLFPHKLALAARKTNTRIIQIATDCVFDGAKGLYTECDVHNAIDIYGKTKSLGEVFSDNTMNLRCSIIGKEKKSYLSLLEWFLKQPEKAEVYGYKNHLWNGITTKAFADICIGIIKHDFWFSGVQHIVPKDEATKAQMLHLFAKIFDRDDINIKNINADENINRTLSTKYQKRNNKLWKLAGYNSIPTIEEMVNDIR